MSPLVLFSLLSVAAALPLGFSDFPEPFPGSDGPFYPYGPGSDGPVYPYGPGSDGPVFPFGPGSDGPIYPYGPGSDGPVYPFGPDSSSGPNFPYDFSPVPLNLPRPAEKPAGAVNDVALDASEFVTDDFAPATSESPIYYN